MEHSGTVGTTAHRARRRRPPRSVGAPGAVVVVLGGIVAAWALGACTATESCVSWAGFPDDATRTEQADLVVDATVLEQAGTRSMFGDEANVWEVEVAAAVKGDADPGDRIEVVSTPQTCSGETYPEGDPLDVDGEVRLYLQDAASFQLPGSGTGWALITPFDGVGEAS